jgi:hypothetical protein
MEKDNMTNLLKGLHEAITDQGLTQENIKQLELLDKVRVTQILAADKQCRKLRMGSVPWSPALRLARQDIVTG